MGIDQILANVPQTLIPIALIVYYANQNNIKWMQERKEIIDALAEERREWLAWQKSTIERQFELQETRFSLQERIAVALEALKTEMHTFRGKVQELMGRYELIAPPRRRTRDDDTAQGGE